METEAGHTNVSVYSIRSLDHKGLPIFFLIPDPEGCLTLTTCSSRVIEDSSDVTRTSRTSCQEVNVTHFSEIT